MKSQLPTYHYFLKDGSPDIGSILPNAIGIHLKEYHGNGDHLWQEVTYRFWSNPRPLLADLLSIARFVYLVDCRSKRSQWGRNFRVVIPVNAPEIWSSSLVMDQLINALGFVSGDQWDFIFVKRVTPFTITSQPSIIQDSMVHKVCLLSEGLDSICGIVDHLQNEDAKFLAVSALMQHQSHSIINSTIGTLNWLYDNRIAPLQVPLYRKNSQKRGTEEDTHRTRSFLLLVIGAIAALTLNQDRVEIFENGIEAFNFPLQPSRCPERFSRAMHPIFLRRMSLLVSEIVDKPFSFSAPYLFSTKADLVKLIYGKLPESSLIETVSCMHFPQRKPNGDQCGICMNCMLRRFALSSLEITDPYQGRYQFDIYSGHRSNGFTDNEDALWQPLYEFQQKIHWLKQALGASKPFRELLLLSGEPWRQEELLQSAAFVSGVKEDEVETHLLRLYRKFEWEWEIGRERIPAISKILQFVPHEFNEDCLV